MLNVVAFVSDRSKPPEQRVWDGPWVKPASRHEMFRDFAEWNDRALAILDASPLLMSSSQPVMPISHPQLIQTPQKWALHDLEPLQRWTVDRVSLLGDSVSTTFCGTSVSVLNLMGEAHASLPHNGAGAGQAIEDSYVLSQLLAHPECTADTIPSFLVAYERVRRPRASRQQTHCRETGEVSLIVNAAFHQ